MLAISLQHTHALLTAFTTGQAQTAVSLIFLSRLSGGSKATTPLSKLYPALRFENLLLSIFGFVLGESFIVVVV